MLGTLREGIVAVADVFFWKVELVTGNYSDIN